MQLGNLITIISLMVTFSITWASPAKKPISTAKTQAQQNSITPAQALTKLKEGNMRFMNDKMRNRDLVKQAKSSAQGQFPFAVIVSCMDSRGAPEIIFDQGIGDVFVQRLAGHVINSDVLGGLEFATKISGAKLIVVLGHTACGAVKGSCSDAKLGNLTTLLEKIRPAVDKVATTNPQLKCDNEHYVNDIAEQHVLLSIAAIKRDSEIIRSLAEQGQVDIVGAIHNIATGEVKF